VDEIAGILLELLIGGPVVVARLLGEERRQEVERRQADRPAVVPDVPLRPRPRVVLPEAAPAAQYVGPGYVTRVGKDSHCLVCGDSLERHVVACPRCATLHHQECWSYNGGCSTYGCRRAA
jgi:hypothetical protein